MRCLPPPSADVENDALPPLNVDRYTAFVACVALIGALAACEMGLKLCGVKLAGSGVAAAMVFVIFPMLYTVASAPSLTDSSSVGACLARCSTSEISLTGWKMRSFFTSSGIFSRSLVLLSG